MKNIKRFMLPAVLASALMLAACGSEEDDAAEVEAETEEVAEVEEEETEVEEEVETVEDVEEEEPNPYNEYDQEVGIYPENDADVVGSDDVDAANKIAKDMATNEMTSRLKAYERLIRPLDTDTHEPFNAETAYEAIERTESETNIWNHAGAEYIKAHHPDLDPVDDRDEIREILRDPEQGAFRIGAANGAISRMQMFK